MSRPNLRLALPLLACGLVAAPLRAAEPAGYSISAFRAALGQAAVAVTVRQPKPPAAPKEHTATVVTADKIEGQQDVRVDASGRVVVERDSTRLDADRVQYDLLSDEAVATGDVVLKRGADTIRGPRLRYRVEEQVGEFDTPTYEIVRKRPARVSKQAISAGVTRPADVTVHGHGQAESIALEGENRYHLKNATFTTCEANDPAWYVKAKELDLDFDRNVGDATHGTFHFGGIPVMYAPAAPFPLSGERRSGLLAPTIGISNVTGLDVTLPYYLNLAPNYDDTVVPRYIARRGVQLNNEFRYLNPGYVGSLRTEYLARDEVYGESRSAVSFIHDQQFGRGFTGRINYNAVSDKDYFTDLSSRVTQTSTDNLMREASLSYNAGSWFSGSVLTQRIQSLTGSPQYNRLPVITGLAYLPEVGGFSLKMPMEAANFHRADSDQGWRTYVYPQIAYNFVRPGGYITPKIGVHATRYALEDRVSSGPLDESRVLPIGSVDAGLFFERDSHIGHRDVVQTLEPRLYYLKVPYRNQNSLPVFDSAPMDFGFAQIFSENLYAGQDRYANASQVTGSVTSRLLNAENGEELLRTAFGVRMYFEDQKVTLPGETARTEQLADLLGAFSGRVLPNTTLDLFAQYNPRDTRMERGTVGLRYQPGFAKVASASYRYQRLSYTDVDLALQWPVVNNFYVVGRVNGDIRTDKLTQAIAGLEYNGGCWVFRLAAESLLNTSGAYTNAYYFQFEFGGAISIGNSPVSLLERSVVGYGRISQPVSDPVFGSQ
ncbi:LPS-assembly protein LptD [Niveibacterium sp. COAC-50]|uniref:LPS-assembly protein LptD n=1 Tax=Niveibacterium sp. COAC-50 TaxID=2729384 RepID=UPI00155617F4|nr:LPS-assembly protein LptD [Niveibacterium sp. COAC-50]